MAVYLTHIWDILLWLRVATIPWRCTSGQTNKKTHHQEIKPPRNKVVTRPSGSPLLKIMDLKCDTPTVARSTRPSSNNNNGEDDDDDREQRQERSQPEISNIVYMHRSENIPGVVRTNGVFCLAWWCSHSLVHPTTNTPPQHPRLISATRLHDLSAPSITSWHAKRVGMGVHQFLLYGEI